MTSDGRIMGVSIRVDTDGGLESWQPQKLFQARALKTFDLCDATSDGQRFPINVPLEWASALPITVVTNWTEKLKEMMWRAWRHSSAGHMVEIAQLRKPYTF
jgi:hypothetical protein